MPTFEEMMGEAQPVAAPVTKKAKNPSAITPEEMGVTDTVEEADQSFLKHAVTTAGSWYKGSHEHPIDNLVGMGKGIAGGMVQLGRLGATGLAGLTKTTLQAIQDPYSIKDIRSGKPLEQVTSNINNAQEMVQKFVEADKKYSEGIFYINLAPKNKQEEAVQQFLGLIPEGIHAAGETVYEKTGSALAGAGSEAMLTLLTMKPSVASKALGGLKKVGPKGKRGGKEIKNAFEELAVKDPDAAQTLAEHVGKADPELEGLLKKAMEEAKAKTPEEIGKQSAQDKKVDITGMGTAGFKQVGTTATGKPRVRAVEQAPPAYKVGGEEGKFTILRADGKQIGGTIATREQAKLKADQLNELAEKNAELRQKAVAAQQAADGLSKTVEQGMEALAKVANAPKTELPPGVTREASLKAANEAATKQAKKQLMDEKASYRYADNGDSVEALVDGKVVGKVSTENGKIVADISVQDKFQRAGIGTKMYKMLKQRHKELGFGTVLTPEGKAFSESVKKLPDNKLDKPSPWAQSTVKPDPVVFTDNGRPVTRSSIQSAFKLGNDVLDKTPGVRVVKGKLEEYYEQLIRTINPEALGPEAKTGASILAKHIAEQMQKDSSYHHRSGARRTFWNHRMEDAENFIDYFEKNRKFEDKLLNDAAEGYKKWNEEIYKQDKRSGIEYDPIDNYLYHLFEKSDEVAKFFTQKYGPKWNNPKFVKERSFDLYEEARKAGYKPKFDNPEDLMLARQHASDIATMRVNVLKEMEQVGLAKLTDSKGSNRPTNWPATEWRGPDGKRYWVHDSASSVMHNAFNTRSLWNLPGIGGDLFRGAMFLKNTIVPIKLALSLFHPLHVATIHNATAMTRASKQLLAGTMNPGKWMVEMVKGTLYSDFFSAPKQGYRILKAYQGKVKDIDLTPADQQSLQYMAEGGFIPEMAAQYKTNAIANFKQAVERRSVKALWHLPFAAIMALQKPMFEIWIPSLKISSYLKDVKSAVQADPSLIENPTKRQLAFRRLAKSVDNRYGEMAYNTLFWNRWVKDLGVANTLSLGWQLGFIREYGGGMLDIGQTLTREGGIAQKAQTGMLDRPLFVAFYTTQALAYGGLMSWALSGEEPEGLIDYLYPKSGETKPDGSPERLTTMYYPREFSAIYKHVEHEGLLGGMGHLAANKASGVIGMTREWATGVNSFGQEIRDPDAPLYKQLEQTLANTLFELEPISVGAIRGGGSASGFSDYAKQFATRAAEKPGKAALDIAGFSNAPKYVTASKTETLIRGTYQKYFAPTQTSFDKAQFSDDRRKLRQYFDNGDQEAYGNLIDKMQEKYELTGKELRKLETSITGGEDPLLDMFSRLTWKQQKKILDQMTEDERAQFLPRANRDHLRYSYSPPEEK